MNQETRQDLLIALSSISIITTLGGSVFSNNILGKHCPLFMKEYSGLQKFSLHAIGGVCGFGVITGALLSILLALQLYLIINLKDVKQYKTQRFILAILTTIILSIYFVIQFLANSSFNYVMRGRDSILGLWEYMLPTYLLQGILLYLLFTEPDP